MAEQEYEEHELPLMSVGRKLQEARKAAGLSLDDIASRTRIARRHLLSIEEDRFSDLAGRTYALGFTRSYARAVGLDEGPLTDAVRAELSNDGDARAAALGEQFDPGDPARVPPSLLAWISGLGAVGVLVLLLIFWRSFLDPAVYLPDLIQDTPPEPAVAGDAETTDVSESTVLSENTPAADSDPAPSVVPQGPSTPVIEVLKPGSSDGT